MILNRLVNQAEEILEEEQAGFRSRRGTTEQRCIQLKAVGGKVFGTPEGSLSWFHQLQESI